MQHLDKYLTALYKRPAPAKPIRKTAPAAELSDEDGDAEDEEGEDPECEPVDDEEETVEAAAEEDDGR